MDIKRLATASLTWVEPSRSRATVGLLVVLALLPSLGWTQPLDSFERLALLVNLHDRVQVEEQSGTVYTGRLTRLTRSDIVIETAAGTRRFTSNQVRAVFLSSHRLTRGALIGAAGFAVLGSIAICAHRGGSDCATVGALGAAPIGAGVGLMIASLVPGMKPVYRAGEHRLVAGLSPVAEEAPASLLEDLGLRVNLNDHLRVEDESGRWTTGRLTNLTADEMTLLAEAGERHFTRAELRQVRVRRRALRTGILIGAGTGAGISALSECRGGAHADCPDGVIIGAALGAGAGAFVGALINRTSTVYSREDKRTFVRPQFSRAGVAVTVTRSW